MDIVLEGSTYPILLEFVDGNNNAVTPSAARYRIDNVGGNSITGNNANAWVSFTPSGNTYELVITANENAVANANNRREERTVTVEFTYGANSYKQTGEYRFMLKNLDYL
jgi:hypothetical protein